MIVALLAVILLGSGLSSSNPTKGICRVINSNQCLEDASTSFSVYYVESLQFYRAFGRTWLPCDNCSTPERYPDKNASYAFHLNPPANGKQICSANSSKEVKIVNKSYYAIHLCKIDKIAYQTSHLNTSFFRHANGTPDMTFVCSSSLHGRGPTLFTPDDKRKDDSASEVTTGLPRLVNWSYCYYDDILERVGFFFGGFLACAISVLCCRCCGRVCCKRQKLERSISNKRLVDHKEGPPNPKTPSTVVPHQVAPPQMVTPKVVHPTVVPPKLASIELVTPSYPTSSDTFPSNLRRNGRSTTPPNDTGLCVTWTQPGHCNIAVDTDEQHDPASNYDEVMPWPPAGGGKPQPPIYDAMEW